MSFEEIADMSEKWEPHYDVLSSYCFGCGKHNQELCDTCEYCGHCCRRNHCPTIVQRGASLIVKRNADEPAPNMIDTYDGQWRN